MPKSKFIQSFLNSTKFFYSIVVLFNSKVDNDRLFSGSFDGTVNVFDASNLSADKDEAINFANENDNDYYDNEIDNY